MANAEFLITLRDGESAGALLRYAPGSVMRGEVRLTANEQVNCRGAYLRLMWHTEGRGDRDQAKVDEIVLATGAIPAGTNMARAFEFNLPEQPWSFTGKYVNIIWEILGVIDMPMATDVVVSEPFILAPPRA